MAKKINQQLNTLAAYLNMDRTNKGLSILAQANAIGLSVNTLRLVLNGEKVTQRVLEQILEHYNISVDYALTMFEECKNFKKQSTDTYRIGENNVVLTRITEVISKAGNKAIKVEFENSVEGFEYYATIALRSPYLSKFEHCFNISILNDGINTINKNIKNGKKYYGTVIVSRQDKYVEFEYKLNPDFARMLL